MAYDLSEDEDAPEEDDEDVEGEEEEGSGKKKKLIIIGAVAAVLLLGGGGAAAYFLGLFGGGSGETEYAEADPLAPPVYYELPEIMVDIKTTSRRTPFIKVKVMLELGHEEHVERAQTVEPRIIDGFQSFLREQTRADLLGKAGTEKMRHEFILIVNRSMKPVKVRNILFRDIILQ